MGPSGPLEIGCGIAIFWGGATSDVGPAKVDTSEGPVSICAFFEDPPLIRIGAAFMGAVLRGIGGLEEDRRNDEGMDDEEEIEEDEAVDRLEDSGVEIEGPDDDGDSMREELEGFAFESRALMWDGAVPKCTTLLTRRRSALGIAFQGFPKRCLRRISSERAL